MSPGHSDEPAIQVRDMTAAEFESYLDRMLPSHAAAGAKATGMAPEAALEEARRQIATLLPDGPNTAGQHLKSVRLTSGDSAGILWYASQLQASPAHLFLYDIVVEAARRGEGLGTTCMHWLEKEGTRLGASEIRLHVFTENAHAVRLYERLGFVVTMNRGGGMQMTKSLA
jgi:GNAT superfamily N-acetyltransferase